jgi:hypothetical protein
MTKPQFGAWRRDVMFITDEIDSFKRASNEIATALGEQGFVADKVYANPAVEENAAHQRAIQDGIDEGRLLVHFIGHGGRYIWRTGPPDLKKNQDLFTLDDVGRLDNGARMPMVLSMTCYSAPFDNPTEDSIGERFLREKDKGAIAVFAASWRNSPSPAYSKGVIEELLVPGATIGEAIVRAKKRSQDRTLVEMYNLLGDPAVVLERPRDEARLALGGDRWDRGVLVDLGQPGFEGQVTVDWLDDAGAKLSSATYRVSDARFRLATPPNAAAVRVYAASPSTGFSTIATTSHRPATPARSCSSIARRRCAARSSSTTRSASCRCRRRASCTRSIAGRDSSPINRSATSSTSRSCRRRARARRRSRPHRSRRTSGGRRRPRSRARTPGSRP